MGNSSSRRNKKNKKIQCIFCRDTKKISVMKREICTKCHGEKCIFCRWNGFTFTETKNLACEHCYQT